MTYCILAVIPFSPVHPYCPVSYTWFSFLLLYVCSWAWQNNNSYDLLKRKNICNWIKYSSFINLRFPCNIYWCDKGEEWDRDYLLHQAQLEDTRKIITTMQQTVTYSTLQSREESGQKRMKPHFTPVKFLLYYSIELLYFSVKLLLSLFCFLVINEASLNFIWTHVTLIPHHSCSHHQESV